MATRHGQEGKAQIHPISSGSSQVEPLTGVVVGQSSTELSKKSELNDEKERVPSSHTSGSDLDDKAEKDNGVAGATQRKTKWYSKLNPLRLRRPPAVPEERRVSREYKAGFLSTITFQWMSPLMMTGYLRPLELQDIWLVNPNRSVDILSDRLDTSFKRRVERGDRYPLLWAIYETFKFEFWLGGICQVFSSLLQVFTPYLTRYLIAFASDAYIAKVTKRPAPQIGQGLGIAIGICVMQIFQSLSTSQFFFRGMMTGGQSRAALVNAIFTKATKLSGRAKAGGKENEHNSNQSHEEELQTAKDGVMKDIFERKVRRKSKPKVSAQTAAKLAGDGSGWNNGKIVALMSIDTDRIDKALGLFHLLWTSPVIIIVALILLIVNIGYSALAGYALLILGVPLLTYVIKSLIVRRRRINVITDQRVSLTQEILQAVRFVKFFGWESSFLDRLKDIRRREIVALQIVMSIRNAILCVSMSLPILASMLAFITYSLSNHKLTPAPIFSSLALFNTLRLPLNILPLVIGQVTDAWTAICRIQEFLLAEEQKEDIKWDKTMENALEVKDASFTWERLPTDPDEEDKTSKMDKKRRKQRKEQSAGKENGRGTGSGTQSPAEPFRLTDLTFSVERNELLAVIGTVGSGKTSLLAALAGDMRMTGGEVTMGASRAFCPQYAWIQNATLKENILFGKQYDEVWYDEVIDACALRADLEMLPAGDETEIGERGITISGGQKQRLNIARAIYFDAGLILMDDPLSAVDAHVGRHIMDNAICGLLKNKCRILATHQLHVLSRCDRIILMNNGHIETVDTFDNLMRGSEMFQRLMATTSQEEEKGDAIEQAEAEEKVDEERKPLKQSEMLMQQEERAVNSVSWKVWWAYIAAFGWPINFPLIVIFLLLCNGANIVTSLWLSYWTSHKFNLSEGVYMGLYAGLGVSQALFMYGFSTILSTSGTNASKTMLQRAMTRVLRAPMSFFDTTPLGRITNRFSKDIHTMDNDLCDAMRIYYLTLTMIISVMFAVALVPLLILFLLAANFYRASAREMKRHESVLRSVVFAQFSEAVSGTASIRAYGLQDHFIRRIRAAIDNMDSAYFLTFSNQRWLSVRLDAVGCLMVLVTGILVVTSRFDVNPSISGLVLSYILAIFQMLQFTVRQLAEVENNMNATERIHYYGTELEEEAPLHLRELSKDWPQNGEIVFSNVEMRYREGLPLVLRGLNMKVHGGERVGIVGRTGAGKSSIMSALFRLTELSGGSIEIDGIDISTVGLHDLRSRLAIIPQDPTLFRGTVRSNLDPFHQYSDLELWSALRKANLVGDESPTPASNLNEESIEATENVNQPQQRIHLDSPVEEEGLNFSLGQRQLMALARALVRNSRIIVCDEATSSVDFETDHKIQQTMVQGFKGKTLLCIAHRLRTIINYDRICVMDQGRIVEFDAPLALWEMGGIFRGMCDRSGILKEDLSAG
ncbi:ATP-binding cassette transporter yor1 [Emydomyces testavorans]|uniref:ATP-binding cassette transporter yor1 n=1 Tax=Emydomyces testavorans TaxID=2070801 RepID=A0AAF0IKA7_9EURO|nr:ATP-binding cassette transporter yor1 [Emydomyces testavorans]